MKICENCGAVLDDKNTLCVFCNSETDQLPIINENQIEIIEPIEHSFYKNEEEIGGNEFLGKKSTDGAIAAKAAIVCLSFIAIALIAVLAWLGSSFGISTLILLLVILVVIILIDFGLIGYAVYIHKRPKYLVAISDTAIILPEQNLEIKFRDIEIISSSIYMLRIQSYPSSVGYIIIRTKSGAEYEEGPIEYVEETANRLNRIVRKHVNNK